MTTKEMTKVQPKEVASVESLINQALVSGASIEVMERLFVLQERAMTINAKKAFDDAMANAQGKFPIIQKKKEGGRTTSGTVAYKYAPIEDIVNQVQKILEENGLSFSFKTQISVDKVKVECIAKHKLGHSESSEMELPFGTKTNVMSAPQVVVATVTFAKRYTFCNVFGITVGGEDTDAKNLPKSQTVTADLIEKINKTKNEDELKAIWEKNKGLGKEFANLITEQKKFLQQVKKDENGNS